MWPTTDSSQSPVPADVRGSVGQFESVGPSIGVEISIYGCDIDCIGFRALAHFCFLRENLRCVIVYVQQVDLQSTRPTRRGNTCRWTEGKRGSQYKHKLCPNSEAEFFEGCIWVSKCILCFPGHEGYNRWIIHGPDYCKIQCTTDFLRETVGLHFRCKHWSST